MVAASTVAEPTCGVPPGSGYAPGLSAAVDPRWLPFGAAILAVLVFPVHRRPRLGGSRVCVCAVILLAVGPLSAAVVPRPRHMVLAWSVLQDPAVSPPSSQQDPKEQDPKEQDPKEQDPKREPGRPPRGVDQAGSAADLLRRLLRGEIEPPTKPEDLPDYVEIPPGPKPPRAGDARVQGPAGPPVPRPERPAEPAFDAARRALERLMPDAAPVVRDAEEVREDPDLPTGPAYVPPLTAAEGSAEATALDAEPRFPIDGQLTLDYRGRRARDGFGGRFPGSVGRSDQDATAILSLDFGDAERHPVTGRVAGRGRFDLDQVQAVNPFNGINETYDDGVELHLWEAWVDVHEVPGFDLVRVGRQTLFDTPRVLFLDGVRAETNDVGPLRFRLGGFVGLPTRFHSGHDAGEFLSGVHGELRPWQGGRARVEWVHVDDERQGFELTDDLIAFSVWQAVGRSGQLRARHTLLDGTGRDVDVRLQGAIESLGLTGRIAYTELLDTQRRLTLEFDPFWESAFDQFPYRQLSAGVTKQLFERFELAAGLDVRRLTDQDFEGQFNRDFERYYATLTWFDDPVDDGLSVSISVDAYDASRGDDVLAVYGDVRWRVREDWDLAVGTDYSLYEYDWQSRTEREDVYAGFLRVEHALRDDLELRVQYEIEDAAGDLFHTFGARLTWTF